jgi:hypothetical protein
MDCVDFLHDNAPLSPGPIVANRVYFGVFGFG